MFFSVKVPMKIAGKTYIPCVCYPVSDFIKLNVDKLVAEGKAVLYSERVFFQNGKALKTKSELIAEEKAVKEAERKAKREAKKSVVKEDLTTEEDKDSF